jgi:hypothetical protein
VSQLPRSDVTDTITDLLATQAPEAPAVPAPGAPGLAATGSPTVRTAAADDSGADTSRNPSAGFSTGEPTPAGKPTASVAPDLHRRVVGRSGRRVDARPRARGVLAPVSTGRPRSEYYGWFGLFMALTGRDIVTVVRVALAALCTGLAAMVAARRLLRPA